MKNRLGLGLKILIGFVLGLILGVVLPGFAEFYKLIGDIFINLVQLIVLPLVLFTIANGILSSTDLGSVRRIGLKTIAFFLVTTMFAIMIGILVGFIGSSGIPVVSFKI